MKNRCIKFSSHLPVGVLDGHALGHDVVTDVGQTARRLQSSRPEEKKRTLK